MELGNQVIFLGALLVTLSIFAGLLSSRLGVPLLLVFLGLGMLVGEDGPGGIHFNDHLSAYVVGSIALALILFDGGLNTSRANMRRARWPALALATLGVLLTAVITGAFASWALGLHWLQGLLMGSIVASTDAAAVFLLLHTRGMRLRERIGATLEIESGLNDPMAVFLTLVCVELIAAGATDVGLDMLGTFAGMLTLQLIGGLLVGLGGGWLLLALVNQVELFPGLYPVLATAMALLIYTGTELIGGSGFLAVFVAGYVLGNHPHRAAQLIERFHDGLAWLAQIVMFLMLGLLVTPSALIPLLLPALAVAAFLIVAARPLAVILCLLPFRFQPKEVAFVSWVGLRGAVAIFLGTIPVLAGLQHATTYLAVAYVVVLTSLVVQGWSIGPMARRLDLELPLRPAAAPRIDLDLPTRTGHDIAGYTVQPRSMAVRRRLDRLPFPDDVTLVSVIQDGRARPPTEVERLAPGDHVLVMARRERMELLDRIFAAPAYREGPALSALGEFTFDAEAPIEAIAEFYGFRVPPPERGRSAGAFLRRYLRGRPRTGSALRVGDVELVVRATEGSRITRVTIELDPERWSRRRFDPLRIWARALWYDAIERLRRGRRLPQPDPPTPDRTIEHRRVDP
jgi:potassium/hydrogen antiporter